MVVSELRGEKIDIIPHNDEPARFVAKALSPARVREVLVDDEEKQATVIVPDDQLSLAIGRDGQNARLAARLTGWKVDIKSETEFAEVEGDIEYEGEDVADGRCTAILTTGRRCPNAALQGSQYCGLPTHQSLARFATSHVAVLSPLSEQDIAVLSDPDGDEGTVKEIVTRAEAEFDEAAAAAEAEQAAAVVEAEQAAADAEAETEAAGEGEATEEAEAGEEAEGEAPEAGEEDAADGPGREAEEPSVKSGEFVADPEEAEEAAGEEKEVAEAEEEEAEAVADVEEELDREVEEVEEVISENEGVGEATPEDVEEAQSEGADDTVPHPEATQ
jgi:N utilization substance protein A